MDAKKIKDALSLVHQYEKKEGRFNAVKGAIENIGLDKSERGVLFNAVNLPADEQKKLMNHRSQIGGMTKEAVKQPMTKLDRQVVATLVREGRKDLAKGYLRELAVAKTPPADGVKKALNNAQFTLQQFAHKDPAYKPLLKKLQSLSAEIFKTIKERG